MANYGTKSLFVALVLGMLAYSNKASSQSYFGLNYEKFDLFVYPKKCIDTLEFALKDKYVGHKLKIFLKDCRGEAYFELFDSSNVLRMTGHYDNAIDTLRDYRFGKYLAQPEGVEKYSIRSILYLYPLMAREWVFYEGEGQEMKRRVKTYIYTRL